MIHGFFYTCEFHTISSIYCHWSLKPARNPMPHPRPPVLFRCCQSHRPRQERWPGDRRWHGQHIRVVFHVFVPLVLMIYSFYICLYHFIPNSLEQSCTLQKLDIIIPMFWTSLEHPTDRINLHLAVVDLCEYDHTSSHLAPPE